MDTACAHSSLRILRAEEGEVVVKLDVEGLGLLLRQGRDSRGVRGEPCACVGPARELKFGPWMTPTDHCQSRMTS